MTEAMGSLHRSPWQSARTASTINVARFGGAPPPQRSLPVFRIDLGVFPSGRRSLRGDDARAAGRAVLRAINSTDRQPSAVFISKDDW